MMAKIALHRDEIVSLQEVMAYDSPEYAEVRGVKRKALPTLLTEMDDTCERYYCMDELRPPDSACR